MIPVEAIELVINYLETCKDYVNEELDSIQKNNSEFKSPLTIIEVTNFHKGQKSSLELAIKELRKVLDDYGKGKP